MTMGELALPFVCSHMGEEEMLHLTSCHLQQAGELSPSHQSGRAGLAPQLLQISTVELTINVKVEGGLAQRA